MKLFLFIVLNCFSFVSHAEFYKVSRVVDGDTVVLQGIGKVRLIGVDTPETVHPPKAVEYFGVEASNYLKSLLENQSVRIEYDIQRQDRYQRVLVYLYLKDGTFINKSIIENGFGHAYVKYPFKYMEEFRQAEIMARNQKRGLWADKSPKSINQGVCQRKTCSQISSCEEAIRLLKTCNMTGLDRDGDGFPCESLCKKRSIPIIDF